MRTSRRFAPFALVALTGCLFETTPPERREVPGETVDPNQIVVTGLVQLVDRIDRDITPGWGWAVAVTWYRTVNGQPQVLTRNVVYAGTDGVYRATYPSNLATRASFAPRVCVLNIDELNGCCLANPPCMGDVCDVWLPPRTIDVAPGARQQQNLVVYCDYVP